MNIRLLSYNLMYGGRDDGDDRRLRQQIGLIHARQPHVLLLQEADGLDAQGAAPLYRLEDELSMRGFLALAPATRQHLAIFIREPLRALSFVTDDRHFHHVLANLKVAVPGMDEPLNVVCTHLCPFAPAVRRLEAAYLIGTVSTKGRTVIAGDLNSHAPRDPVPDNFRLLPADHRVRHLADDLQSVDTSVLQLFEAAGWTDIGRRFGDATPTAPTAGMPERPLPHHRSDYILASPGLVDAFSAYQVLRNADTDTASDHYPLEVDITL